MALIDDLLHYYQLDEAAGDALDEHGSNDGSDVDTVGSDTGKLNNARRFNGTSEWFTLGSAVTLTGPFSLSCWIYADALTSTGPPARVVVGNSSFGNAITVTTTYGVVARFGNAVNTDFVDGGFRTGQWDHLVVTRDGSDVVKCYRNGTLVNSFTQSGTFAFDRIADHNSASFDSPWDGLIDELGVWERELTSSEAAELYNSGTPLAYPFSGGGPETYTAAASLVAGGASFSGSGTVTTPTYAGSAALTAGAAGFNGTAAFASAVFQASAALTARGAGFAGAGTTTTPTYAGSAALTAGGAGLAGSAATTAPSYTAAASLAASGATFAATGTFAVETYTAAADLTAAGAELTGEATFAAGTKTAAAVLVAAAAGFDGTALVTNPTYTGSAVLTAGAAEFGGEAATAVVPGPYHVAAVRVFLPGPEAAHIFLPGPAAAQLVPEV